MPVTNLDLRPAYREPYGSIPTSDRSRVRDLEEDISNPLKALEMRELQEEENWIKNLKMQRDKVSCTQIEEFRKEIETRDYRIRALEEELLRLKGSASELIKLQAALDKSETQLRIRDKDLTLQADNFKKQIKDLQIAMDDMRAAARQDSEQYSRELQK